LFELKAAKLELKKTKIKLGDTNLENSDKHQARSNTLPPHNSATQATKNKGPPHIFISL